MPIIKDDKSTWAIGGMTLIGVGVGLIFVQVVPPITVASKIIGVGLSLVISPFISRAKE
tara:strand:+ start:5874 stop:6050 length:177 start_codon:yes stop_codon:yes gene_type:complete